MHNDKLLSHSKFYAHLEQSLFLKLYICHIGVCHYMIYMFPLEREREREREMCVCVCVYNF